MDISQHEAGMSAMQEVKRRFFALRNGVVADALRSNGSPFRIIFGLNLPQLREIASFAGKDAELAEALWANTSTRESMLLAPMLYPGADFGKDKALRWLEEAPVAEVVDGLCHSLLRHQPYAEELALHLLESKERQKLYGGLRLTLNVLPRMDKEALRANVEAMEDAAADAPELRRLRFQVLEELDFLEGKC